MFFRHIITIMLILFFTACSGLTSLEKEITVEKEYENDIKVGNKTIPLPEGKWKVVGRGLTSNDSFFIVYLFQEKPDGLFSYLMITTESPFSSSSGFFGYKRDDNFDRTNMLYVKSISNKEGEAQEGWYINNSICHFAQDSKTKAEIASKEYIKSHNLTISNDMISVTHRFASKGPGNSYLRVEYFYNPEADGFQKSTSEYWSTSPWNSIRINSDQNKVAYVEKLKKYHAEIHDRIKTDYQKHRGPETLPRIRGLY
jgi:hypothetical protein